MLRLYKLCNTKSQELHLPDNIPRLEVRYNLIFSKHCISYLVLIVFVSPLSLSLPSIALFLLSLSSPPLRSPHRLHCSCPALSWQIPLARCHGRNTHTDMPVDVLKLCQIQQGEAVAAGRQSDWSASEPSRKTNHSQLASLHSEHVTDRLALST